MSAKPWKDALLATGQPLEHSTTRILAEFDLAPPREYGYIPNENGIATEFSVDLHTSQMGIDRDIPCWADYLIECKYRREGTRWIFTPEEHEGVLGPRLKDTLVILDALADEYRVDRNYLESFSHSYTFCSRGCEIIDKERNLVTIEQAVSLLKYAVPNLAADAMEHQIRHLLGSQSPIFIIASILVTTAELWCLDSGTTIEAIRAANDLSEVAKRHDILILYHPPDNLLQWYSLSVLRGRFSEDKLKDIDEALKASGMNSFGHYTEVMARYWPSHFVVVHYSRFRECIRRLTGFMPSKQLYKTNG
jgi:hypothetical protein